MQTNSEVRSKMREKRIPAWMIADAEHVHENTVLRRLRHELPDSEKARILALIDDLAKEKAVNA